MSDSTIPEIGLSIDAGGIKTNYHDIGEGQPIVLLHGSGPGVTAYANWRLNMPEFAKDFRVIAPDMVAFGYTESPKEGVKDKAVWINHLLAFLDALGLEKVSLVGNSFGGFLSLAFMIAHPERVERAVIMGGPGIEIPLTEELNKAWGYTPSVENMRELLGYLSSDPSRITDELVQSRYEASRRPGAHEPYAATFGPEPRQRHIAMLSSREEDLAKITHEVLIMHGKLDRVLAAEHSLTLGNLIRNSDVQIFGNCGHWVQIERMASFNRIVTNFFKHGLAS